MAFKIAASLAYKKGLDMAKPILLEPIMSVEIEVPENYMGDVMADINKRRGRVMGMEAYGKLQRITAEIPMSEMFSYAIDLRSITQARGEYRSEFLRYEEVPIVESDKIIASIKK